MKGCQQRHRLDPHTTEAQSISVFEGRVVHSRPKGQEQHLLSVGSYLSFFHLGQGSLLRSVIHSRLRRSFLFQLRFPYFPSRMIC